MSRKSRLPDDVVVEILSRLPAESLIRYKCVHNSWYVLIEDSKFVAMQLRNHASRNNNSLQMLLLSKCGRFATNLLDALNIPERTIISMLRYDGEVVSLVGNDVDLIGNIYESSCCCNGIVCFYGDCSEPVIIANPGIRQFQVLPKSCIPYPEPDCHPTIAALGLGFDIRTNDYKVVRIIDFISYYGSPANYHDVEVYSLSSNSWRQIDSIIANDYGFYDDLMSSYWNGAYYWLACKNNYPNPLANGILFFNFSDEVFQFLSIPEVVSSAISYHCRLDEHGIIELNGTQALVSFSGWSFDIWDMDSFGIRGTWTKLLSSGSLNIDEHITYKPTGVGQSGMNNSQLRVASVLGVYKKDELLLLLTSGQVASFSFLTKKMKVLPTDSEHKYYYGTSYKSSLVSINSRYNSNG